MEHKKSNLVYGKYSNPAVPDLHGRNCFKVLFGTEDKVMKLSLRNPYLRGDENGTHCIIEDIDDDWCTVKLLRHYIQTFLPEDWDDVLFLRPVRNYEKLRSEGKGKCCIGDSTMCKRPGGEKVPRGKLGCHYVSDMFKRFATRCKFNNPNRFTGRSARRAHVTQAARKY